MILLTPLERAVKKINSNDLTISTDDKEKKYILYIYIYYFKKQNIYSF